MQQTFHQANPPAVNKKFPTLSKIQQMVNDVQDPKHIWKNKVADVIFGRKLFFASKNYSS